MGIDAATHGVLELACAGVALYAGARITERSARLRSERWRYALGVSLVVAGLLDVAHAVVSTLPPFTGGRRSPTVHLVPWTGSLARIWLVAGAARSAVALRGFGYRVGLRTAGIVEVAAALGLLALALLVELPRPYVDTWPHRPLDFALSVPLAVLAVTYRRHSDIWPLLALSAAGCLAVASSMGRDDGWYALAHVAESAGVLWIGWWEWRRQAGRCS